MGQEKDAAPGRRVLKGRTVRPVGATGPGTAPRGRAFEGEREQGGGDRRTQDRGGEGQRDRNGLTPWHYQGGRQVLCGTCDMRPCADRCTEQWMPDTLQMRAARANMTIAEWAAAHPDWVGWALHIDRADVRAFLIGAAIGLRDAAFGAPADTPPLVGAQDRTPIAERDQTPIQERRALPLDVAMAQAMALLTGGARAAELAPAYAAKEDGSDAG